MIDRTTITRRIRIAALCLASALCSMAPAQTINLPSSKQILAPVPGAPQRLNSLPMAMAWSPDHRYLAIINAGYGTVESDYQQSIAVLDTATGKLTDFPDPRTGLRAAQTLYSGLAFSLDGAHLYASFDSLSAPEGGGDGDTGNAIAVYRFSEGAITPERLIPIPLQRLAPDHTQNRLGKPLPPGVAIPAPTGLAVLRGSNGEEQILVADDFSDDVLLVDTASGKVVKRFDLADHPIVPAAYPIAVIATRDNRRAFVALWNGSAVAEIDLRSGRILQKLPLLPPASPTSPSSHPTALAFSPDQSTLYVTLANHDSVAVIRLKGQAMRLAGTLDTRLPGQSYFGAIPSALALSADGRHLYVANSGSDAVAVFDTHVKLKTHAPGHPMGFLPTEWFPTAVAVKGNELYVATDKGKGTGPNTPPQARPAPPALLPARIRKPHTYIATLLHGSLASINLTQAESELPKLTAAVVTSNRITAAQQHLQFKAGKDPIRHVIYIIKENRTYDQILGDLGVGDGDPSLTMYGESITPNEHKLAKQFGVLDYFYDSGEVSGDGHVWSTAGITSDYTEKTWQQAYRGSERRYDYEGVVEEGFPLAEGIPDINAPESGYLWTNMARHGKTYYHFGEYVDSQFCSTAAKEMPQSASPLNGTPELTSGPCARPAILPGTEIPAAYGGGKSPYPWAIPLIYKDVATKPELVGHFDPLAADFNLRFPDQLRVERFLAHFRGWVKDRKQGHDDMPQFILLRLPDDHTAGTRPGWPTPRASVADNDLAVGRAVEAVSHSPYWNDTAFFILEDDAQNGADHVDAHRSLALVISKYSPRRTTPVVDHHFYTTVSVIRTMEDLLGLPPMNNNDAFAPLIQPEFSGAGDQPAYNADYSNRDNGLIYTANKSDAEGAKQSSKMDFTHEDRANPRTLNVILWKDAMGSKPVPWMLLHPRQERKDADD